MVNYYFSERFNNILLRSENDSRSIDDMSFVKSSYVYWDKIYVIPEDGVLDINGEKKEVKKGNLLMILYRNFDKTNKKDVVIIDSDVFYSNYLSNTIHNGGVEEEEED